MKKILLAAIFLVFHFQMLAQDTTAATINSVPPADRYIYLYTTVGRQQLSHYYCFLEDGKQVLVVKKHGKIATFKLEKPDIFALVENNEAELTAVLMNVEMQPKNQQAFLTDFNNSNIVVGQVGIKSSFMEYNHFTARNSKFIAGVKDEKTKKGLQVINKLVEVLDKASQSVIAD